MRIAVCIKRVPITGGRILLTDDARAINTQHLGFTMSPHEECGVEEAARLIEANKGDSVVLTLGPPEAVEQLRAGLTAREGLNLPRYPSVPGKMRARSKPVAVATPTRPAPRLELVRLAVPAGQGRRAESLGNGATAAPAVVEVLRKAGVL